jgi:hypothetical protein
MKRRIFLWTSAAAAIGGALRSRAAQTPEKEAAASEPVEDDTSVDPYFLESGDLTEEEKSQVVDFERYQDQVGRGEDAVMPRGGRPKRAPKFRFVHWTGNLGDPDGTFIGPMSVQPGLQEYPAFRVNAQILGFNICSDDWKRVERGTLSLEFRGRLYNEPLTWLYAQQFDVFEGRGTNLALEQLAERNGQPDPMLVDEPNLDVRIQLMRQPRKAGFLRKVMKLAAFVVGLPVGGGGGKLTGLAQAVPSVRVPMMLREGVALSYALFGASAQEKPLWSSSFNPYALAPDGSRLKLVPGIWVAIDESRQLDLRGARPEDVGGTVALTRDGQTIDANYLVLEVGIENGEL